MTNDIDFGEFPIMNSNKYSFKKSLAINIIIFSVPHCFSAQTLNYRRKLRSSMVSQVPPETSCWDPASKAQRGPRKRVMTFLK